MVVGGDGTVAVMAGPSRCAVGAAATVRAVRSVPSLSLGDMAAALGADRGDLRAQMSSLGVRGRCAQAAALLVGGGGSIPATDRAVRQAALAHPALPPAAARDARTTSDRPVTRSDAARLARSYNPMDRSAAASEWTCPAAVLERLCDDPSSDVVHWALTNPTTPQRRLRDASRRGGHSRVTGLARNPRCRPGVMRHLASDPNLRRSTWRHVREALALNSACPPDLLAEMFDEPDDNLHHCEHMRTALAMHPASDGDLLWAVYNSATRADVMLRLAEHPSAPEPLLQVLRNSSHSEVRDRARAPRQPQPPPYRTPTPPWNPFGGLSPPR